MNMTDIEEILFQDVINDYEYGHPQSQKELYAAAGRFLGFVPRQTLTNEPQNR